MPDLPALTALRYVQPLREGGSLPAVVATDDGLYVVKFRGAGQGPKALIAELICAQLARLLGLPTPDPAVVEVPPLFGRAEPDSEIRELLAKSTGTNVGLRYLDGAFNFALSPAHDVIAPDLAARIVWFDALVTNPDRTHRNVNILVWQRRPYLIDHGAALYAHHDWTLVDDERTRTPFPLIRHHTLLAAAGDGAAVDEELAARIDEPALAAILAAVPDALLRDERIAADFPSAEAARQRYVRYLHRRLVPPRAFVAEAVAAQAARRAEPAVHLAARR
ncbi:MAG TPA: HipA family kinase [Thermoanaerobaculia bacterium]|nr:HipA family kinase [Thermoanaerobaculia bacterium]